MKKYSTLLLFLFLLLPSYPGASPLHFKLHHKVIIDTDCSDNDLIAVSLLLSHPGIIVEAVFISDGEMKREEGRDRIENLLHQFNADTIPVLYWSDSGATDNDGKILHGESSAGDLPGILQSVDDEATIICLGSIYDVGQKLPDIPDILYEKIEEIIWFINPDDANDSAGHKTQLSEGLVKTGIKINMISPGGQSAQSFGTYAGSICDQSVTRLSDIITDILITAPQSEDSTPGEILAALFMSNPELFEMDPTDEGPSVYINTGQSNDAIREVITDMISGQYRSGHFIALYGFPLNPELYFYDVRLILDSAVARYGIEEWKACVMTDEFHGHLGVFSIVGAKMGIYAREFFGVGTDVLEIVSYAGNEEPFSCMNDGLQVSTGATLGQNLIHLAEDEEVKPQALFSYNDQSILIRLKPEYLKELKAVIEKGKKYWGLEDEGYWNLIRQTSIKYWLEWDREKIFLLEVL